MIFKNAEIGFEDLGSGVKRKILAHGGTMMSVKVFFEKGSIGELHTHEHEQVCYVLKGKFEIQIGDKKDIICEGDTYYAEPNIPHGVKALEEGILLDTFTPQREDFLKK